MRKPTVVLGFAGTTLDAGKTAARWHKWRPTVSLFQHDDFVVDRLELWHQPGHIALAKLLRDDIAQVSPETTVNLHPLPIEDPWAFEEVFTVLADFAHAFPFDPDNEDYLIHITTGSHVAQICEFLLTEAHWLPARLIQTSPASRGRTEPGHTIIDLELSRYDAIAQRYAQQAELDVSFLKGGIDTRNVAFNKLIERIERVALKSDAPLLLTGPTGAGKTQLARRIYEMKKRRRLVHGDLVELNCATLRGDQAMSALFGHRKGAFTGAVSDRPGLLRAADGGMLFLDEVGELGADEQAMLLKALETGRFLPVGSDKEVASQFVLVAGTNRDLRAATRTGDFREDLLARINLWTFEMPALVDRREDIEPNLRFELDKWAQRTGQRISFNREASDRFERFAVKEATWPGNFRDLNAAVTRMATLAPGGRIDRETVDEEIELQRRNTARAGSTAPSEDYLFELLGEAAVAELDLFDRLQLAQVVDVCRGCPSMSEAGRRLFAVSRASKAKPNDADRIRKYLLRFGIDWADLHPAG